MADAIDELVDKYGSLFRRSFFRNMHRRGYADELRAHISDVLEGIHERHASPYNFSTVIAPTYSGGTQTAYPIDRLASEYLSIREGIGNTYIQ
ncbi:hypothetical protein H6504_01580 [Candidatus Woesearchaeota archaeon]|nr:hypothetical protein [Candidatus Woesearchaeota archaeon]